jgi:ElaB/YqjD/DUF883 family membrane-anchored ribosome-binding protein
MTNDPEQLRADIEETRRELGGDVDALADKVRPSSIVNRKKEQVKGAMSRARDAVMGTASDAASTVGDTVGELPHKAAQTARGNPIAVGLIAFGVGLLAASMLPTSSKERRLAASAKDMAEPAVDQLKQSAHTVAEDMKEPAKDAAESVKSAAQDAADNVKQQASSSGGGSSTSAPDTGQQPPPATVGGVGVTGASPTAPRDPLGGGTTGI